MIYSLNGKLKKATPNFIVIECSGVGYGCFISLYTRSNLPSVGEEAEVLTTMLVRQEGVELFAFYDAEEQECFRLLTGVSGVGPKSALSILSLLEPSKLSLAIAAGDHKMLTKAQGIGAKTAQRIVLELKDKMGAGMVSSVDVSSSVSVSKPSGNVSEAMAALVALGYTPSEAALAVTSFDDSVSVNDIVKGALKAIASKG